MWNLFFPFGSWGRVNRGGSLLLPTTSVAVSTTAVTFSLPPFRAPGMFCTLFINITNAIPEGTDTTLPIVFSAYGTTQAATKYNGEALTVADLQGTGVYEFFYNRAANTLQLLGSTPAATAATPATAGKTPATTGE